MDNQIRISLGKKLFLSRLLIGLVFFINVQCAVAFIGSPGLYSRSFELSGIPGEVMVRGMGILFLMWNVPYFFAFCHPRKNRLSLYSAVTMQLIGWAGESMLLLTIPDRFSLLRGVAYRFILFDGFGLVLLVASVWITRNQKTGY